MGVVEEGNAVVAVEPGGLAVGKKLRQEEILVRGRTNREFTDANTNLPRLVVGDFVPIDFQRRLVLEVLDLVRLRTDPFGDSPGAPFAHSGN